MATNFELVLIQAIEICSLYECLYQYSVFIMHAYGKGYKHFVLQECYKDNADFERLIHSIIALVYVPLLYIQVA